VPQPVFLTAGEREAIIKLGGRLRAARLRRNITQATMAERAGITRKTWIDLESGKPTVNLSVLVKAMTILGYLDRIPGLLETDPDGEDIEATLGRKHASAKLGFADF
jgi:transcriptional regulator with XRE-family HTH domain